VKGKHKKRRHRSGPKSGKCPQELKERIHRELEVSPAKTERDDVSVFLPLEASSHVLSADDRIAKDLHHKSETTVQLLVVQELSQVFQSEG
jgi:hypothetical protein